MTLQTLKKGKTNSHSFFFSLATAVFDSDADHCENTSDIQLAKLLVSDVIMRITFSIREIDN